MAAWGAAFLLPLALYLPTLRYGFVFDDQPLIVKNPALERSVAVGAYFARDVDALRLDADAATSNYYRPLLMVVLRAGRVVCGTRPWAWHLAVAGLHASVGLLAMLFLASRGFPRPQALLASLAFSAHPVHVDAVAWVSGVQDVWLGVSALLAALAWQACRERRSWDRLALLAVAYAVALLSKEAAVGLLLFAACDAFIARRERADTAGVNAALVLLFVLTGAYLALRWHVLGALARPLPSSPALPLALASLPRVTLEYLRLSLLPFDLALLSPLRPVAAVLGADVLVALLALVAVLAGAAWMVRRWPEALGPLIWFGAWLAPCLALWSLNREWLVMDRYLYLPVLAPCWLVLVLTRGRLQIGLLAALTAVHAMLTLAHMPVFRDERVFWARMLEADPQSSTAWAEHGRLLIDAGDRRQGRAALERALAIAPDNLLPALRLAGLELAEGRAAAAAEGYRRLIRRSPGYAPPWRNLPVALHQGGHAQEALVAAREAVARFPRDVEARLNLATLLRALGQREEALVTLAPVGVDARAALRSALLLVELGRREQAQAVVRGALLLLPGDPSLRAQLEALEARLR